MKLHSLFFNIFTFVFVIVFFISPSFFSAFINSCDYTHFSEWNFPLQQLFLCLAAIAVYFVSVNLKKKEEIKNVSKNFYFVFFIITPFIFTFLLLFCNSLIFSFISSFKIFKSSLQIAVEMPDSFLEWIYCIMNFFFAAFYEEIIYRYYFIDELNQLCNKFNRKIFMWIFEAAGLLIFAVSHYYMGIVSVFNAAVAHVILRVCYKKSGSIFPGFFAHFCYNIISLILL